MTRICVLGAGSWGTTVAGMLTARAPTTLWARSAEIAHELREHRTNATYLGAHRLPPSLRATSDLADALEDATLVVVAVPSHGLRAVLERGRPCVPESTPVLSLSKGLEETTSRRMSEVIAQCWGARPIGVLTGPNLAGEVLAGQPTAAVVAFPDDELARELQGLLGSDTMRIYTNPDVVGCEISGAVKNVMAIAAGMAVGLGFGDNTRAALITRALAELTRLGVALGGMAPTFAGLAGLGDLVATCTSGHSRNFAVGRALGEGHALAEALGATRMIAEGVRTSRPLVELARRCEVEVPVAEEVLAVCYEGRAPAEAIPRLMRRAAKSELEGVGAQVTPGRVLVASDEVTPLVETIVRRARELGYEVEPVAPGAAWPEVGRGVGEAVAAGVATFGVVCCWTGTGVCIAANKVVGVRAALCTDKETASGARRWNDANVLALSLRLTTPALADEILTAFLRGEPDPGEAASVAALEQGASR